MKKYCLLILLIMLSLSSFAQRKALVIGNKDYQDEGIPTSLNDAKLATDALKAINYDVTQLADLDYSAMNQAIENFVKSLTTSDVAVFYYTGYTKQISGKNFLIPLSEKGAKASNEKLISIEDVLSKLRKASYSFVFLENRSQKRSFFKKLCPKNKGLEAIENLGNNQGFAMASTLGKDLTAQGERYSIFTYTLFTKITSDMYDFPDLMNNVRTEVESYTSEAQKPHWQSNLQAPFTFWEPTQALKFRFRLPSYRGLDGGGSYNF
ncbi:MAG: caspase family protein [Candidatus Cloacimonetes bacterium]|nr:caspase family protein [Candidatus Cloacimonadota bacterium]